MNLGEQIYKLRTGKEMSQVDLADALGVSRQSISKWETNSSVPELDKLVKLSEIFGISLDELILDRKPSEQPVEPKANVIHAERSDARSLRKTVGVVLLSFAGLVWLMILLFGDVLGGLVLAAPFVACGLICLFVKKDAGLWCAWVVYLFIDIYLRFASGIHWQYVLVSRLYSEEWTIHLTVAWILCLAFSSLTVITAVRSRKTMPGRLRIDGLGTVAAWGIYLLSWFVFVLPAYDAESAVVYSQAHRYVSAVSGWVRNIVFAVSVIFTMRLIVTLLSKRKGCV